MNLEIVKQGIQIMSRLLLNACTCFTQSPCKCDFTKNLQNVGSCDTVLYILKKMSMADPALLHCKMEISFGM